MTSFRKHGLTLVETYFRLLVACSMHAKFYYQQISYLQVFRDHVPNHISAVIIQSEGWDWYGMAVLCEKFKL